MKKCHLTQKGPRAIGPYSTCTIAGGCCYVSGMLGVIPEAGALIEGAGLKGYRVGGAQVSELHAGFVVNAGGATARDVLALMDDVRRIVFEQTGVTLEPEVRVIGEDG